MSVNHDTRRDICNPAERPAVARRYKLLDCAKALAIFASGSLGWPAGEAEHCCHLGYFGYFGANSEVPGPGMRTGLPFDTGHVE